MREMIFLQAAGLGPEAQALVAARSQGRVLAVLHNAVYLESERGEIVGIVGDAAVDGPMALGVHDLPAAIFALKGQERASFHAADQWLEIGEVVRIMWAHACRFTPRYPCTIAPPEARFDAAGRLAEAIAVAGRAEGSARLAGLMQAITSARRVGGEPLSPTHGALVHGALAGPEWAGDQVLRRVASILLELVVALRDGRVERAVDLLTGLLGLGPGLTPSGDDMVAGILASLNWRGRLGGISYLAARELAERVLAQAPRLTNKISARMLWHAAGGTLYAPAMSLGAALLAGDAPAVDAPARRLFGVGSTTGVDLAVGLLFGTLVACSDHEAGMPLMLHG